MCAGTFFNSPLTYGTHARPLFSLCCWPGPVGTVGRLDPILQHLLIIDLAIFVFLKPTSTGESAQSSNHSATPPQLGGLYRRETSPAHRVQAWRASHDFSERAPASPPRPPHASATNQIAIGLPSNPPAASPRPPCQRPSRLRSFDSSALRGQRAAAIRKAVTRIDRARSGQKRPFARRRTTA